MKTAGVGESDSHLPTVLARAALSRWPSLCQPVTNYSTVTESIAIIKRRQ